MPILTRGGYTPFPAKPVFAASIEPSGRVRERPAPSAASCRRQAALTATTSLGLSGWLWGCLGFQAPRVVIRGEFPDNHARVSPRPVCYLFQLCLLSMFGSFESGNMV